MGCIRSTSRRYTLAPHVRLLSDAVKLEVTVLMRSTIEMLASACAAQCVSYVELGWGAINANAEDSNARNLSASARIVMFCKC